MNDITTPTGMAPCGETTLETTSAPRRRMAPAIADAGIRNLLSASVAMRMRWGTIRPMNPIIPALHTMTDTANAVVTSVAVLRLSTFIPRDFAPASPMDRMFSLLESRPMAIIAGMQTAATRGRSSQYTPETVPTCHT